MDVIIIVVGVISIATLFTFMHKFAWRDRKPSEKVNKKEEKVSIFNTMETFKDKVEKDINPKYAPPVQAIIDIVKSEQYSVQDFLDYAEGDIEWLESMLEVREGTFVVENKDRYSYSTTALYATFYVTDTLGNRFMLTRFTQGDSYNQYYAYQSDTFTTEEAEALWSVIIADGSSNLYNLRTAIETLEKQFKREKMVKDYEKYQNS